ncbi:DUF4357 domain-containing protein [uncultured Polaribacter sp.]|uniref:DUF4357 domain-containing protein n=1 Tax=uncultured Polaribacter sp. TaxID=174711 RepID=UPI0030D7AB85
MRLLIRSNYSIFHVNLRGTILLDGSRISIREAELNKSVYVFQQDYVCNSPSGAAAVVLARAANGWTEWKDKEGNTLDALKRK